MKGLSLILPILMLLSVPVFSYISLSCIFVHRLFSTCLCYCFLYDFLYTTMYIHLIMCHFLCLCMWAFFCAPIYFSEGVSINFWSLFMPWSTHVSVCLCVCMSVCLDVYKFCVLYVYIHFGVTLCLYDFGLFSLSFFLNFNLFMVFSISIWF